MEPGESMQRANAESTGSGVAYCSTFPTAKRAIWMLVGSACGMVFWLVMVLMLFLTPNANSMMPGMLGGMAVVWFLPLIGGVRLLRSVQKVVLDDRGIDVHGALSKRRIEWTEVAKLERGKADASMWSGGKTFKQRTASVDALKLKDAKGRTLVELVGTLERFPELVGAVEQLSAAAQGRPTYDAAATITGKVRRSRITIFATGTMLMIAGIGLLLLTHGQAGDNERYRAEGREVDAAVLGVKPFMGNYKVSYEFHDTAGKTFQRDGVCTMRSLDLIDEEHQTVRVRYVPSDPDFSRLAQGDLADPKDDQPPMVGYLVGAAGMLMGGLVLGAGFMGVVDLKIANGKVKVVRAGDVTDALAEDSTQERTASGPSFTVTIPTGVAGAGGGESGRPAGITAIGVLNLIYGGAVALINVARVGFMAWLIGQPRPVQMGSYFLDPSSVSIVQLVNSIITLAASVVLMVAGVLLLRMRMTGRWLSIGASVVLLAGGMVRLVQGIMEIVRASNDPVAPSQAGLFGMAAGMVILGLSMIYPLTVLILMSRRAAGVMLREAANQPPADAV